MSPGLNVLGDAGVVVVLTVTWALPVHTPFTEITSLLCTSENVTLPVLLMLCILINTPFLNSTAVACPMPPMKVKVTSTGFEWGAPSATRAFAESSGIVMVLVLAFDVGIDLALDAGFLFFALLAMEWCLLV